MVHALAIALDEPRNKIVADRVGRTLNKFQLETGYLHICNHEVAFRTGDMRLPPGRGGREIPGEELRRPADCPDRDGNVIKMRKPVRRGPRVRRIEVRHLPELDERSEG